MIIIIFFFIIQDVDLSQRVCVCASVCVCLLVAPTNKTNRRTILISKSGILLMVRAGRLLGPQTCKALTWAHRNEKSLHSLPENCGWTMKRHYYYLLSWSTLCCNRKSRSIYSNYIHLIKRAKVSNGMGERGRTRERNIARNLCFW